MGRREKFAKAGLSAAHETRELLRITQNARFALIIGSSRNVTALSRHVRMANSGFRIYAMAYSARMRFLFLVYLVAAVTSLHAETGFLSEWLERLIRTDHHRFQKLDGFKPSSSHGQFRLSDLCNGL